jgi:TetR/AcrR family transcriptional regulator, regulator of autoinduction and epiphytic fitness
MEPTKSPGNVRHLSPEKTAAILEGATRIFLEEGYAGTTMDRVAAASGVSKATLYSHFQGKEGLFNVLMEQMVQKMQWAKYVEDLRKSAPDQPEFVLRRLAQDMLNSCVGNPERITFIRLVIGESGRFPELGRAFVQNADKPSLEALTNYLMTCQDLRLNNPAATARIFMSTLIYFFISQEMMHGADILPMQSEQLIDQLIDLIMARHASA